MIGGFIVLNGNQKVIIRAIGPSLPVVGKLGDPTLELHDHNGVLLQSNDNWKSTQQAEIVATGVPPTKDAESAIVRTLPPGNYTAIVRGRNSTTGVALVEVFSLGGSAATSESDAPQSGVRGKAVEGPVMPVEQEGQDNNKPLPGAIITLQPATGGDELARTVADSNGEFQLGITAGNYLMVPLPPDPQGSWPRAIPQSVTVKEQQFTDVVVQYDTGIR
jgi:hypothetical protein